MQAQRARRLSEEEWGRVSARLHGDAQLRAARLASQRQEQARAFAAASGSGGGGWGSVAPAINEASSRMERGVDCLEAWEAARQIRGFMAAADKEEHAYAGVTFTPEINARSRSLALNSWASKQPDPRRPWTAAPVVTAAPAARSVP
ncbi:hypothetical protein MNEG_8157 [Monoraphidium neglectum]|uniref:Uncharacterized protein n=1 Tax=Monoraphidium neglectum TaxID=145388 RepID=A0A0D2JKL7_9CHLO|nr:hypothetical protein MNEG_8157 [Monoraphidium neglectum]KIY99807.1 hypothetical protein MNEG_8157 [Monoraphidium neglectum]|eukprot:XP_013898827.1 hypothetical protein MNEG_8157 [Monoraphidium neglectum]